LNKNEIKENEGNGNEVNDDEVKENEVNNGKIVIVNPLNNLVYRPFMPGTEYFDDGNVPEVMPIIPAQLQNRLTPSAIEHIHSRHFIYHRERLRHRMKATKKRRFGTR